MADIVYEYDDVPTIKQFSKSDKFIRGLMGPFGSGKSSGCVIELIKIANKQLPGIDGKRRARFACIRNTYPQLQDTTIKTFHDWVPPHLFGTFIKHPPAYLIDKMAPDLEIEVLFRALDRPEHVSNLLSLELTAAWVNEAREVPRQVIEALQGRVGRYPSVKNGGCVDPCIIMDTNPPDTDSWWYTLFEEKKPNNAAIFKQPSGVGEGAENRRFLPANYYENLLSSMDKETAAVYVHGQYGYIRDGKPCYPEYNDAMHCQDVEPVQGVQVYRGWDFGLMPACTFHQVLPDGRWLTFDEVVGDTLDIYSFADEVMSHTAQKYPWIDKPIDIGDPAGMARNALAKKDEPQSNFEVLHSKGIYVEAGEQTLTIRLGAVKWALNNNLRGQARAIVHSRCKMLRRGYQGRYQFRRLKIAGTEERYHEEPDKNDFSHPHDANQYVAARLFGDIVKNGAERKPQPMKQPNTRWIV